MRRVGFPLLTRVVTKVVLVVTLQLVGVGVASLTTTELTRVHDGCCCSVI